MIGCKIHSAIWYLFNNCSKLHLYLLAKVYIFSFHHMCSFVVLGDEGDISINKNYDTLMKQRNKYI